MSSSGVGSAKRRITGFVNYDRVSLERIRDRATANEPVVRRMKQSNRGTRTVRKNNIDDLENDEKNRKEHSQQQAEEQSQPQAKRTKGLRPRQRERCETVLRVDHSKDSENQRGEGLQQIRD